MSAAEMLLERVVDYAGLFPPAALDMASAVRNYQTYLNGDEACMLGSFLVPATRLEEFATAFDGVCCSEQESPWTLGVVCAGAVGSDGRRIEEFQQGAALIGSLEAKAADAQSAASLLQQLPAARARYVEFPPERASEILPVLGEYGARAKVRMGGVTAESIPSVETVAEFLSACARERLAWKATAGLHHAVRGKHALMDGPVSPQATMHGFVNLFFAGAMTWFGADPADVAGVLAEEDPAAFRIDDDLIGWRDDVLTSDQIELVRREFAMSFGSCSFTEPVDELQRLGWV